MTELIARRTFSPLYIWLDIAFLIVLGTVLLFKKKYMTFLVGLLAGFLYMLVDYGIFHLVCHARTISEGYSLFWVLLWMSMSYGFTNFVWIWLWISKDKNLFEWSLLILGWWFCCPLITGTFTDGEALTRLNGTHRRTSRLYGDYSVCRISRTDSLESFLQKQTNRVPIPWLLAIGILVQLGWEAGLLLGGIQERRF